MRPSYPPIRPSDPWEADRRHRRYFSLALFGLVNMGGTYLLIQKGFEQGFGTKLQPSARSQSLFSIPMPLWVACLFGLAISILIPVAIYYMWRAERNARP